MKNFRDGFFRNCLFFLISSALFTFVSAATYAPQSSNRTETLLQADWLFNASDVANGQATGTSESGWKNVCVPHPNVITKHANQSESAFWFISWYRKHFTPPSSQSGRRFLLEFEGVSIVATVYVNGIQMGSHQGGYTPFTIDITSQVTVGQDNLIAVKVDSREQSAVPPEGGSLDFMIYGGIVRNVRLIVVDPLHVDWIFSSTTNTKVQTAPTSPTLNIKTRVVNNGSSSKSCTVINNVVDKSNNVVATISGTQSVSANGSYEFNLTTPAIGSPNLWSPDSPYLYTVFTQVQDGSTYVDEHRERIGIRTLTMDKANGPLYINGKTLKIRGLNRHETYPFIGRAAPRSLQRKDADILKYDLGCNTVRTSHYPQAPDFLDRCDEIGLLVLEEVPGWMYVGNDAWKALEMQVLKDMIVRDRNHPSIFTFGVRINESADDNVYYQKMNDTARFYDPSRLTCGVRRSNSDPATSFLEDIWTQNFLGPTSAPPNMPVITSEEIGHGYPANSFSTEDILITLATAKHAAQQNKSYAEPKWGGMLGWCAFDYASSHNNAVANNLNRYVSNHGMADIFRINKFAGEFFKSQRDPTLYGPMVSILNYWRSDSPTKIYVASNCDQVELFINGTSKGKINPNEYTSLPQPLFSWANSSISSGSLKADGYIGATKVVSQTWSTPGTPTKITLTPDTTILSTDGDMTRVVVMVGDANNPFVPYNTTSVTLSVSGVGDFIGESPIAMEHGMSAFYVRSRASQTGTITCSATASGLTAGSATITVIGVNVDKQPTSLLGPVPSTMQKTLFKQVMGSTFIVPEWARKNSLVLVYNLSGKLVFRTNRPGAVIDFSGIGATGNAYLVKIIPKKSAL